MKKLFLPSTALGKWSVGLAISFIVLFVLVIVLVTTGQERGETYFSNLLMAIPGLLVLVTGIAAFFTGIIGITKSKERAVAVFITTIIGFFVLTFVSGEFVSPH